MAGLDELFGGSGARTVKFEDEGDTFTGTVVDVKVEQAKDFDSGEPATWPDGKPRMQQVFTFEVEPEDDEDTGKRRLYVDKPRMRKAILEALKDAGVKDKAEIIGGKLSVKFTGRDLEWENPRTKRKPSKNNAPKLWAAKFERGKAPVEDVFADDSIPF